MTLLALFLLLIFLAALLALGAGSGGGPGPNYHGREPRRDPPEEVDEEEPKK